MSLRLIILIGSNMILVRLIFVGPIPHSTKGKGEYSSIVLQNGRRRMFLKIVRLGTEGS